MLGRRLRGWGCPHDCPCDAPRQRLWSQQQPTRLIGQVLETAEFTGNFVTFREACCELANRRLQPLGHLTADSKYT